MPSIDFSESTTEDVPRPKRNRWIAVILGLFCAGVGLLYCGRTALATLVAICSVLLGVFICWVFTAGPSWLLSLWMMFSITGLFVVANVIITWRVASKSTVDFVPHSISRFLFYILWQTTVIGSGYGVLWMFGDPQSFKMPSASMEDTLLIGDTFIAGMSAYDNASPKRGDIVVFVYPVDNVTKYVKRCVALPGDTVEVRDTTFYVNGLPQKRPATVKFIDGYGHQTKTSYLPTFLGQNQRDYFGPYVVPKDCYFMLGDNRDNSADSRIWGPVNKEHLLGKALRIVYSPHDERVGTYLY